VHHRIGARRVESRVHSGEVKDVPTVDDDAIRDAGEVRVRRILVRDAMHDVALDHKALGEMAARESRDAGDEDGARHRRRVLVRGGERRRYGRERKPDRECDDEQHGHR